MAASCKSVTPGSEPACQVRRRFTRLENHFKFDSRFEEEQIRTVEFADFGQLHRDYIRRAEVRLTVDCTRRQDWK